MSVEAQFVRLKPLSLKDKRHGADIVRVAARHNTREDQVERGASQSIDVRRMGLNVVLAGPLAADEIVDAVNAAVGGASNLRRNSTVCVEVLMSLSPGNRVDEVAYWRDCLQWVRDYFDVPVVSAIVHNDEAAPHMHVLMVPIRKGRLIGSELMGGLSELHATRNAFHAAVGAKHGLSKGCDARPLKASLRRAMAPRVLARIKAAARLSDLLSDPVVSAALLATIEANPVPLMAAFGVPMPADHQAGERTFAQVMAKPQKRESEGAIRL
jgi:hypothetical protein